jgi:hypothetical protein
LNLVLSLDSEEKKQIETVMVLNHGN